MFITAVCVLFLMNLRWPKNKSILVAVFMHTARKEEKKKKRKIFLLIKIGFKSTGKKSKQTHA